MSDLDREPPATDAPEPENGSAPPIVLPDTAEASDPAQPAALPDRAPTAPPPPTGAPQPGGAMANLAGARPDPRVPTPLRPAWLIGALATAVAADIALRLAPWNNLAGAALIVVLAAGLLASGFVTTNSGRLLTAAAVFFGLFLAVRTEPLLVAANIVIACGLLVLAAIHGRDRSFWDLRPLRVVSDAGALLMEGITGVVEVPAEVSARIRVAKEQSTGDGRGTTWAVLKGVMIATPIVLVLGLLLASADAVFQSFFSGFGGLDVGATIGHLLLLAVGAYAMLVLLRLAASQGGADPAQRAPGLGSIEATITLVAVNILFAAFAVAQLLTVLGGADDALTRAGLDSKHFARQGFFQLLWVAGITLALLMVLRVTTAGNSRGTTLIKGLSLLTAALTLLIVAVALTRIAFYIDEGGMTPLRLYAGVVSVWIGLGFCIVAVRIWGVRADQAWLLPTLVVTGLAILAGLNVASPERIIANDNLARDHEALFWHIEAEQFSDEGKAVLAADIDRLSPELAAKVERQLCVRHGRRDYPDGLLGYNLGNRRAERELTALCS